MLKIVPELFFCAAAGLFFYPRRWQTTNLERRVENTVRTRGNFLFFFFFFLTLSPLTLLRLGTRRACVETIDSQLLKKWKLALKQILFLFTTQLFCGQHARSPPPSRSHSLHFEVSGSVLWLHFPLRVRFFFFFLSSLAIKSQRSNHTQTSPITQQRWLSYTDTPVEVIKSLCVPFLSFPSLIFPSCSVVLH